MLELKIKPLSINEAYKGRRYKTDKYIKYKRDVLLMLPKITIPEGFLQIELCFGFSSFGSDFDNPVKPFVDILQKKYGFNDNRIKHAVISIENVKKGKEYIRFNISGIIV